MGLRARRLFRGPTLTASHRQRRLNWEQSHVRWRRNQLNNVLFTDESRFMLNEANGSAMYTAERVNVILPLVLNVEMLTAAEA